MRVLHLNAGNLFGGIEGNLLTLARFREVVPGSEMDYGACFDARPAAEMRAAGVPVFTFGAVRLSRPWTIVAARRRFAELLRSTDYDVVVAHGPWVLLIFGPLVRRKRIPLVLWAHDRAGQGGVLDQLARRCRPDFIVCNSHYTAASMAAAFPEAPSDVIYCPVVPLSKGDGFDRAAVRRKFNTPLDALVLIQVGRWESHKGHLNQVAAMARLADKPNWVCWQVGAPQIPAEQHYQDEVRKAAERFGIADRYRFLGWQPQLGDLLAAADIYCQPNTRPEPFGIAIVEALAAGLPVIASAEAGPAEILTPECGRLVISNDITALARAIGELLASPDQRRALGAAGPSRAAELCDPITQVSRFAETCRGLVLKVSAPPVAVTA